MRAVRRAERGGPSSDAQRLEKLADALIEKAIGGDAPALKEIGDRLDGRPHQSASIAQVHRRACDFTEDELLAIAGIGDGLGSAGPDEI